MEYPTHRRDRTVYVNNIVKFTTEDDLFSLFQKAGPVEKVIFKNAHGTPQHALIVFRRVDSVMFCLDNADLFRLKGQQLGIRPLRESRLSAQSKVPYSAGYEAVHQRQHFSFDFDSIQRLRLRSDETDMNRNHPLPRSNWQSTPTPPVMLEDAPRGRRISKPPPLQLSQNIKQIWVPPNCDSSTDHFTAPPFSAPPNRFSFQRSFDDFPGV